VGNKRPQAREVALLVALAGLAISRFRCRALSPGRILTVARVPWIPQLGIEYHLAADGISLVARAADRNCGHGRHSVSPGTSSTAPENSSPSTWLLIGGVYGVFLSFDLLLLFVFYEIAIIPKYFLIAIWGSSPRDAVPAPTPGHCANTQR
jgi:NADH-quinone oxidoreductase subunit M